MLLFVYYCFKCSYILFFILSGIIKIVIVFFLDIQLCILTHDIKTYFDTARFG